MWIILLISTWVTAQRTTEQFNFIPPAPKSAALGKYGVTPVRHYSSVPNITIPIYTINAGSYSMPISLSYHSTAQGLKPRNSLAE